MENPDQFFSTGTEFYRSLETRAATAFTILARETNKDDCVRHRQRLEALETKTMGIGLPSAAFIII
jgi:hypothetical protein